MVAERRGVHAEAAQGRLSFMVNRKLAVGFATWVSVSLRDADDPMAKALRYFLNRNLARGWVCWHALYAGRSARWSRCAAA